MFEDSSRVSGFFKKYKKHVIGISVTFVILVIIATAIGLRSGLKGLYFNVKIILLRKAIFLIHYENDSILIG